jgi:hypothetical protein
MSISGYRGDIVVYSPPVPTYRPAPPVIYNPYRPIPPSVDVYVPTSRPLPPLVGAHTSRKGNLVIDDYATGQKTTIVEHGRRAGEVIHGHIR